MLPRGGFSAAGSFSFEGVYMLRGLTLACLLVSLNGCGGAPGANAQEALEVGQQWFTTRGHIACIDRPKLDIIIGLVAAEDSGTLGRILSASQEECFRLRPGLVVTVASIARDNEHILEVRPEGMQGTIWLVRQAVVRTREEIPPPEDTTTTGG